VCLSLSLSLCVSLSLSVCVCVCVCVCLLCAAGVCFRLYSLQMYEDEMPASRCPAVTESNLSHLVLLLKRLDIADMGQCKFLDRPGQSSQTHTSRLKLLAFGDRSDRISFYVCISILVYVSVIV